MGEICLKYRSEPAAAVAAPKKRMNKNNNGGERKRRSGGGERESVGVVVGFCLVDLDFEEDRTQREQQHWACTRLRKTNKQRGRGGARRERERGKKGKDGGVLDGWLGRGNQPLPCACARLSEGSSFLVGERRGERGSEDKDKGTAHTGRGGAGKGGKRNQTPDRRQGPPDQTHTAKPNQ